MAAVAAGVEAGVSMAAVAEAFAVVTVEAASAVVMEVIEAVTGAGDMVVDGAVGDMA
jgi:hypothetical protein